MPTVSVQRVAEVFVEVADTLTEEFDVVEFLQLVAWRTTEILDVDAAGLLLADQDGQLRYLAASDDRTRLLQLAEAQHREGPSLDAFRSGSMVFAPDLAAAAARWPHFVPRVLAAGYGSVHTVPMQLRGDVIGALNLFTRPVSTLDAADVMIAQALVNVATIGVLQERAIRRGEVLTRQLQGALNSRVVIEQAKGALSQIRGISVDEAFDLMRRYARSRGRRLAEVAGAVVNDDRAGVSELTGP